MTSAENHQSCVTRVCFRQYPSQVTKMKNDGTVRAKARIVRIMGQNTTRGGYTQ